VVSNELKNYGHNIKRLIEVSNIRDEFKISELEDFYNEFVHDYRFIQDGKLIFLKDSESIRFGSLAGKTDLAQSVQYHFSQPIVDFLEKLSHFSFSKLTEAKNIFKNRKLIKKQNKQKT